MLATSRSNGTRLISPRYWVQWVTNQSHTDLKVVGYCVRDMDNFDKRLGAIGPGVSFHTRNTLSDADNEKLSVKLNFKKMI